MSAAGEEDNSNMGDSGSEIGKDDNSRNRRMESEGLLPKIVSSMVPYVLSNTLLTTGLVGTDNKTDEGAADSGDGVGAAADVESHQEEGEEGWVATFPDAPLPVPMTPLSPPQPQPTTTIDSGDQQLLQQHHRQQIDRSYNKTTQINTTTTPTVPKHPRWYEHKEPLILWICIVLVVMIGLGTIFAPFYATIVFILACGVAIYYVLVDYIFPRNIL